MFDDCDQYGFFCDLESAETTDDYCDTPKIHRVPENPTASTETPCCLIHNPFSCVTKFPKDIYYSFVVCTVAASCVYLILTLPDHTNKN